mmetsp:Transcript_82171/g.145004  ORF Transcript_82171/g.145004 Transcript_82171/m.145004 type:complete len:466 (+) Transcript_82171:131-1528(+)|eukprot:CAMPEP_0197689916 /NCGR_PEP_ID=MMETSP1338-20131121/107551_1 /TAXON_ID=43686 ORGANISM="Pelagodinium beii, Strain RCC1491" /NCGR_SAMPLE_ID=MMETSP1338 /ASSEMBLY_ACC=CAM_ASM_000754 /LENGTH=465 /DNA_ID=CAMNT_0043272303 /DNA_START=127 /DNA_END=1524 /DNA_ORIENTATION=-
MSTMVERLSPLFGALDETGSGTISCSQFVSVLKKLGQAVAFTDAELETVLSEVGADGNGDIKIESFLAWLTQTQRPAEEPASPRFLATGTAKQVCIVGSGNWGCAIAKVIGENTAKLEGFFNKQVNMWMFDEQVEIQGQKRMLSEVFNETHENVKYLPGIKLPENIVAIPDIQQAVADADILVWVLPHQFVPRTVQNMGEPKPGSVSVSLIKGGLELTGGKLGLCSDLLRQLLQHEVAVLMGANVANEVAEGQFCEATLGCNSREHSRILRKLFDSPKFRVRAVDDIPGVELCGALKNVVALAAGFSDGLGYGGNTKAALIRIGLQEMMLFIRYFYPNVRESTFFESCGLADLITTSFGGRNRKCAEAFARANGQRSWEDIEKELLNGQKLQGTLTAEEIWPVMLEHKLCEHLPLITAIYKVAFQGAPASSVVELPDPDMLDSAAGAKAEPSMEAQYVESGLAGA